jgi:hypothetical protein
MDIQARDQYMETLRTAYYKGDRKKKTEILDEYCRNTGQDRKYVIKKFGYKVRLKGTRKPRKEYYNGPVKVALVKMWEIFDYPCGSRLKPILNAELERLMQFKEIACSDEVLEKMKKIGIATIDRKLRHEKEVLSLDRKYGKKKLFFCHKIPVKTADEFDRSIIGYTEIDFVESCGSSASGEYVNSLSVVDVSTGWWEGEAVIGKSQERAVKAIKNARNRLPFPLLGIHPDNGTNLINALLYNYMLKEGIEFTRSRAYKKNDNCFVEQKNSTHVRAAIGYLRYDTKEEMDLINDIYRNELRLFKNFFQPVLKLKEKVRIKGRVHRKYEEAKTPYQRIMESDQIDAKSKEKLKLAYDNMNPAEIKRGLDRKLDLLCKIYMKKKDSQVVDKYKKQVPFTVSKYMMDRNNYGVLVK